MTLHRNSKINLTNGPIFSKVKIVMDVVWQDFWVNTHHWKFDTGIHFDN